jgi:hypothetical protein
MLSTREFDALQDDLDASHLARQEAYEARYVMMARRLPYEDVLDAVTAALGTYDDSESHPLYPLVRELTESPRDPAYPVEVREAVHLRVGQRLAQLVATIVDALTQQAMEEEDR